jgi:hypothetical protein
MDGKGTVAADPAVILPTVVKASPVTAGSGDRKPRIQSAVRAISIPLAVADSANGLKAKEIMEKVGLSSQVTYHPVHTMHGTGIIRKNESNRYVLGLAAVLLAEGFNRQLAPPEHLARSVRSIVAGADSEPNYSCIKAASKGITRALCQQALRR